MSYNNWQHQMYQQQQMYGPYYAGHQRQMPAYISRQQMAKNQLYTSFEHQRSAPRPLMESGPLGRTARSAPAMREFTIKGVESMVTFFGRKNFLSNFFMSPMSINNQTYPTVEHYYEACKVYALVGGEHARSLKGIVDAGQTKTMSKQLVGHLPKKIVDAWRFGDGILVMKVAVREKFKQSRPLTEQLIRTGDKLLVQTNKFDTFWSVGLDEAELATWLGEQTMPKVIRFPADVTPHNIGQFSVIGKGKNLLGFIIMHVRDLIVSDLAIASELAQLRLNTLADAAATAAVAAVVKKKAESPSTETADGENDENGAEQADDAGSAGLGAAVGAIPAPAAGLEPIGSERSKKKLKAVLSGADTTTKPKK